MHNARVMKKMYRLFASCSIQYLHALMSFMRIFVIFKLNLIFFSFTYGHSFVFAVIETKLISVSRKKTLI